MALNDIIAGMSASEGVRPGIAAGEYPGRVKAHIYSTSGTKQVTVRTDECFDYIHHNAGSSAVAFVVLNLPSAVPGMRFRVLDIYGASGGGFAINPQDADTIQIGATLKAAGAQLTNVATQATGDQVEFFCYAPGKWMAIPSLGTWS